MSCPLSMGTHCAAKMLLALCCPDLTMVILAVAETPRAVTAAQWVKPSPNPVG